MQFLDTEYGAKLAYHQTTGQGPVVVFLGGFKSDMGGTKAIYLEDWAKREGRAFLRFDYTGHGDSSGAFEEGCIGDWARDATAAITALTQGPLVLVGSSMGGWISLLVARAMPERVAGLVGVAAAPDFTADSMWAGFDEGARATLERDGRIELPSEYSDEPYVITERLIKDGWDQLVLRSPLALPCPVRLLQGTADDDVEVSVALRLLDHMEAEDVQLTLVKDADHRFSTDECLAMILTAIEEVSA